MSINVDRSHEVNEFGLSISDSNGDTSFYVTSLDTGSPVGLSAPINSWVFVKDTQRFWKKFSSGDNDWRLFDGTDLPFSNGAFTATNINDAVIEAVNEAVSAAIEIPRSAILLIHNGNQSNNQIVGYSNLTNQSPIVPYRGQVEEITFVNANTSVECNLRFYRNTETVGNLFYTWVLSTGVSRTAYVTSTSFTSPIFERGDKLIIRYDDTGTNANDMTLGIFFKVLGD